MARSTFRPTRKAACWRCAAVTPIADLDRAVPARAACEPACPDKYRRSVSLFLYNQTDLHYLSGQIRSRQIRKGRAMEQDLLKLDGRIVVVSGAAGGGIGTTVTSLVARAGATVIAVSRSEANLDRHVAPLASQGLLVTPVAADAQTEEGVAAVMKSVRGAKGELYGLVNVAGGAAPSTWCPTTRLSREDLRALFAQ